MPMAADRRASRRAALHLPKLGPALNPIQTSEAEKLLEQAGTLLAIRKIHEAHKAFDAAQAAGADPDGCSGGRWFGAMLDGNYEPAWQESDAIRARGAPDPNRFWQGQPLQGARVIVRCLHGFGDAVQMLRYASHLKNIASSVIFEVPPRLLPLAPFFRDVDRVISWDRQASFESPDWNVQMEIMELPYIFRTTIADLPIATSYLNLPDAAVQKAAQAIGQRREPRVGFVWAGGEWNPERSIPFALLQPLLQRKSWECWSLQGDGAASQAKERIESGAMRDATAVCGDGLLALAATIQNLDLVITVDTLAAHLAGALGKSAWVLLQYAADWRWMTARNRSPWYPTMRLFRQPAPGDWPGVIDAVEHALAQRLFVPVEECRWLS